jgi:uncharacterized membrane protein YccF (DUF307 family)
LEVSAVTTALNFLWFILGGWLMGLAWWFAAVLLALTIVGMPWSIAALRIGSFSFFPFGREVIDKRALEGREAPATGAWRFALNVIWFLLGGWYLALGHLIAAVVFAITIIGLPFAVQHLKLAGLSLAPVGKEVVSSALADEARRMNAQRSLASLRGNRTGRK